MSLVQPELPLSKCNSVWLSHNPSRLGVSLGSSPARSTYALARGTSHGSLACGGSGPALFDSQAGLVGKVLCEVTCAKPAHTAPPLVQKKKVGKVLWWEVSSGGACPPVFQRFSIFQIVLSKSSA